LMSVRSRRTFGVYPLWSGWHADFAHSFVVRNSEDYHSHKAAPLGRRNVKPAVGQAK
jgi:hypothetical protein